MEAFLEERRNIKDSFHLINTYLNRPVMSLFIRYQIPKRKKAKNLMKRSRTESHQENKKQSKVRSLEGHFPPPKAAMPTFTLASMPAMKTTTTTTNTMASTPPAT